MLLAFPLTVDAASEPQSAADQAFIAGEFDRAEHLYLLNVQSGMKDAHDLSRLGDLNLFNNRNAIAVSFYKRALAVDPKDKIAARGLKEAQERIQSSVSQPAFGRTTIVPFVTIDPLPVVKVHLDHRRDAYFLLDTGAPGVVIDPALAKELKRDVSSAGSGIFAGGKAAKVEQTTLDSLELGKAEVRNIPVAVLPMAGAPAPEGIHVEGILGTAFFARFLTTLDYAKGRLVLAPRSSAGAFERRAAKSGATPARMWLVGDHFLFARASVNQRFSGFFNIDTGGNGFGLQLAESEVAKSGVTLDVKNKSTMAGPGGEVTAAPFLAAVKLGGFERQSVPGIVTLGGDQYGIFPFKVSGTLTHEFFKGHRVTFDFNAMQMVVD